MSSHDLPPSFYLNRIDVYRTTTTNVANVDEAKIEDFWNSIGENDARHLSKQWTGTVGFHMIPILTGGFTYIADRKTRHQKNSSRPPHVWPEQWEWLSQKEMQKAIQLEVMAKEARAIRGITSPMELLPDRGAIARSLSPLDLNRDVERHSNKEKSQDFQIDTTPGPWEPFSEPSDSDQTDSEPETSQMAGLWRSAYTHLLLARTSKRTRKKIVRRERLAHQRLVAASSPEEAMPCTIYDRLNNAPEPDPEPLPAMPTMSRAMYFAQSTHREKDSYIHPLVIQAFVFHQLSKQETATIPGAKAAMEKEWKKLEDKRCWLVETVEERHIVAKRARAEGKTVHFGRVFGFCAIKHVELSAEKQKYKGRVVFEGNRVRDEEGLNAVFSEQGSSASLMPAGRFLDAVRILPDCHGEQSDAVSAYTQALLYGDGRTTAIDTWVSLPPDRQPESWKKYHDPVCRLRLALYSHVLSGLFWERKCQQALLRQQWEPIPGWQCCYVHKRLGLVLSVYVDDFKMAGLSKNMKEGWETIRKEFELDPPEPFGHFLGCGQSSFTLTNTEVDDRLEQVRPLLRSRDPFTSKIADDELDAGGKTALLSALPKIPEFPNISDPIQDNSSDRESEKTSALHSANRESEKTYAAFRKYRIRKDLWNLYLCTYG